MTGPGDNRSNDTTTCIHTVLETRALLPLATQTHTHLHSPAVTFEGQGPGGRVGFERLDEVEGLAG